MQEKGKMERTCPLVFSFSHVRSRTPQLFVLQNELSFSRLEDFRRVVMHPYATNHSNAQPPNRESEFIQLREPLASHNTNAKNGECHAEVLTR